MIMILYILYTDNTWLLHVYSIQHYVTLKFVSDLWKVVGLLLLLQFRHH